ncbi:MAG: hypothetical protein JNL18_01090 [Planctomycetaceae bacterium]|nr:hypothetical protein [Planctomycetaceae bacterium]
MKFTLVVNLAIGLLLLLWAVYSDVRTFAVASDLADERRSSSPVVQPLEYAELVDLLRRATDAHENVCAAAGGTLIVTSSLGLWLNARRPAAPVPGREADA